jgi:hypothetical protein
MKEALQKKLKKGMCHLFQRGQCARGDSCKFAHVEVVTPTNTMTTSTTSIRSSMDKCSHSTNDSDAPVCMSFQRGKCKRGETCKFRHIGHDDEVTSVDVVVAPKVMNDVPDDAPVCMSFQRGKCKRGQMCKFRHLISGNSPAQTKVEIPATRVPLEAPVGDRSVIAETDFESNIPICQSFQKGKCKRGRNCKFRHTGSGKMDTSAVEPKNINECIGVIIDEEVAEKVVEVMVKRPFDAIVDEQTQDHHEKKSKRKKTKKERQ